MKTRRKPGTKIGTRFKTGTGDKKGNLSKNQNRELEQETELKFKPEETGAKAIKVTQRKAILSGTKKMRTGFKNKIKSKAEGLPKVDT